jgi:hypothetical protein
MGKLGQWDIHFDIPDVRSQGGNSDLVGTVVTLGTGVHSR